MPVKYIKTVDDSKPMQNAFVRERQIEYDMQRKQVLQKLNNDRAKGGEIYNKNLFINFGEIFKSINDLILKYICILEK